MQSGNNLLLTNELFTSAELTKRSRAVFNNSGCNFDLLNSTSFSRCIQSLNASTLFSESNKYYYNTILQGNTVASGIHQMFQLVLDGTEFKESIKDSFSNRRLKNLNVLTGYTLEETAYFVLPILASLKLNQLSLQQTQYLISQLYAFFPRYLIQPNPNFLNQIFNEYSQYFKTNITDFTGTTIQISSDQIFIAPTIDFADFYSKNNNVYVYSFEQLSPVYYDCLNVVLKTQGYNWVAHNDDLAFTFGIPLSKEIQNDVNPKSLFTNKERNFSKQMISYWTNFVKFGNPNGDGSCKKNKYVYWPVMSKSSNKNVRNILVLNSNSTFVTNKISYNGNPRPLAFWKPYENL